MEQQKHDESVNNDVLAAVRAEVAQSRLDAQEKEAEAVTKGIPLEIEGMRYRIYETEKLD